MDEARLKREFTIAMENCTCLGRDAYGAYIEKLANYLVNVVNEEVKKKEESL